MQINTSSLFVNLNGRSPVLQNGFLKLIDKKMHSFYGGNEEITKANTLLYKYRKANPIKIFEKDQKSKPVENVSDIPHEFLVSLNKEEYSWDEFRFQKAFDIGGSGNLDEILSRLAASYVTASEHMNAHFSGTEFEAHRVQLDAAVSKVMEQRANVFVENVGGFLESNGFAGEKNKIYDIITFRHLIQSFLHFQGCQTAHQMINPAQDDWLEIFLPNCTVLLTHLDPAPYHRLSSAPGPYMQYHSTTIHTLFLLGAHNHCSAECTHCTAEFYCCIQMQWRHIFFLSHQQTHCSLKNRLHSLQKRLLVDS